MCIRDRDNVGNFFVDLVRITTRILIPFSIVGGLLLVWQGVPQNFSSNTIVETLEGAKQAIAQGPVAALEIIKHLGTNGGGFLGANSSTPIENPTIISNIIELFSMMLLPGACVITFGKMIRSSKKEREKAESGSTALQVEKRGVVSRIFGREGRTIFLATVSYTHLDVYKRQVSGRGGAAPGGDRCVYHDECAASGIAQRSGRLNHRRRGERTGSGSGV